MDTYHTQCKSIRAEILLIKHSEKYFYGIVFVYPFLVSGEADYFQSNPIVVWNGIRKDEGGRRKTSIREGLSIDDRREVRRIKNIVFSPGKAGHSLIHSLNHGIKELFIIEQNEVHSSRRPNNSNNALGNTLTLTSSMQFH